MAMDPTPDWALGNVFSSRPIAKLQSLSEPSALPVSTDRPSGAKATAFTALPCPLKVWEGRPFTSHNLHAPVMVPTAIVPE